MAIVPVVLMASIWAWATDAGPKPGPAQPMVDAGLPAPKLPVVPPKVEVLNRIEEMRRRLQQQAPVMPPSPE